MLMGIGSLSVAAPIGLIAFLLTTCLGFAVWRRSQEREVFNTA
jgi:hypothetical protein